MFLRKMPQVQQPASPERSGEPLFKSCFCKPVCSIWASSSSWVAYVISAEPTSQDCCGEKWEERLCAPPWSPEEEYNSKEQTKKCVVILELNSGLAINKAAAIVWYPIQTLKC